MKRLTEQLFLVFLKIFFGRKQKNISEYGIVSKILIIRPHNQLGDMIAGSVLFRAIKDKYPDSKLHVLASPMNIAGASKNPFIDDIFSFDKKKLFDVSYLRALYKFLRNGFEITITPVVVSISFTSNLLAGISDGKIKIGAASLNGEINDSDFFFDVRHIIDFRERGELHVWERILENIPGLYHKNSPIQTDILSTITDITGAEKFLHENGYHKPVKLVGIHPGAGKPPNIWPAENFAYVLSKLALRHDIFVYVTGSSSESATYERICSHANFPIYKYFDNSIGELAALISLSDLFITNDTGVMHVAGTTSVRQISLFGPTPPEVWAPKGENKHALRKGDEIKLIETAEVYELADALLSEADKS